MDFSDGILDSLLILLPMYSLLTPFSPSSNPSVKNLVIEHAISLTYFFHYYTMDSFFFFNNKYSFIIIKIYHIQRWDNTLVIFLVDSF